MITTYIFRFSPLFLVESKLCYQGDQTVIFSTPEFWIVLLPDLVGRVAWRAILFCNPDCFLHFKYRPSTIFLRQILIWSHIILSPNKTNFSMWERSETFRGITWFWLPHKHLSGRQKLSYAAYSERLFSYFSCLQFFLGCEWLMNYFPTNFGIMALIVQMGILSSLQIF